MEVVDQVASFLDHARMAILAERYTQALEMLIQAGNLDSKSSDVAMLQAIAFSRLNQNEPAENGFQRAIELNPSSAKIRYNRAVHLQSRGRLHEALEACQGALDVEPSHVGSVELMGQLEDALGVPRSRSSSIVPPPRPVSQSWRAAYEMSVEHTIPWIGKYQSAWTTFGWLTALISLVSTACGVVMLMSSLNAGAQDLTFLLQTSIGAWFKNLWVGALLIQMLFFFLDAVDRKSNAIWIVPILGLALICLGWLGMPLYLLSGRKSAQS